MNELFLKARKRRLYSVIFCSGLCPVGMCKQLQEKSEPLVRGPRGNRTAQQMVGLYERFVNEHLRSATCPYCGRGLFVGKLRGPMPKVVSCRGRHRFDTDVGAWTNVGELKVLEGGEEHDAKGN